LGEAGDLYVFQIPGNGVVENPADESRPKLKPVRVIRNVGDGRNLVRWNNVLVSTWFGNLEVYSLDDPREPKRLGRSRTASKRNYDIETIVRNGDRAFVIGDRVILTYDLSDPSKPKPVAEQRTEYNAYAGCVETGYLYIGGGKRTASGAQEGIAVFDLADASHLKEVAFVPVSRPIYHVFALPGKRLLASLDGDTLTNNPGKTALLDVADPKHPVRIKEVNGRGGRAATVLSTKDGNYFVCKRAVFLIRDQDLVRAFSFDADLFAGNGFPYHCDSDGTYAALASDDIAVILRLRSGQRHQ
jgi:hypothetical protein